MILFKVFSFSEPKMEMPYPIQSIRSWIFEINRTCTFTDQLHNTVIRPHDSYSSSLCVQLPSVQNLIYTPQLGTDKICFICINAITVYLVQRVSWKTKQKKNSNESKRESPRCGLLSSVRHSWYATLWRDVSSDRRHSLLVHGHPCTFGCHFYLW